MFSCVMRHNIRSARIDRLWHNTSHDRATHADIMMLSVCFFKLFTRTSIWHIWKASGAIAKQQRMANGPANRGSLFNVRHAVLHSLRRFLFICSNVLYSRFAIQYSPRRSPFAAPFAIRLVIRRAVRHSPRHSPRRSLFAAPFVIRRAIRYSPRRSPFASSFAAPFVIRRAVSYSYSPIFAIKTSLFNVRRAVSHSQIAIRQSPSHSPFAAPFAAPFAVAFQCPLTLSIDILIEIHEVYMNYLCCQCVDKVLWKLPTYEYDIYILAKASLFGNYPIIHCRQHGIFGLN